MKRLVLHVGPHKTGSTYIQRRLFDNAGQLNSIGVAYPSTGINFLYGHHQIAQLAAHDDLSVLRELLAPLADVEAPLLILSSENFDRLKEDGISKLAACLPDDRAISVLYFRRNPTDLLVSKWQEAVKHGETQSFYEYIEPHICNPFSSEVLNHCLVLDRYSEQFGLTSIRVIDYESAAASGDMFDAFSIACDNPALSQFGGFSVINKSMALWEVELLRVLNAMAQHEGRLRRTNVRTSWLNYKRTNKASSDLKVLLERISSKLLARKRPFSINKCDAIERVDQYFLAKYGNQIERNQIEKSNTAPAKTHEICLAHWLADKNSYEVVSHLFDQLRIDLPVLDNTKGKNKSP